MSKPRRFEYCPEPAGHRSGHCAMSHECRCYCRAILRISRTNLEGAPFKNTTSDRFDTQPILSGSTGSRQYHKSIMARRNVPLYHLLKCLLPLCHAFCSKRQHKVLEAVLQGHVLSDHGRPVLLSEPGRSGGDEPGFEAIRSSLFLLHTYAHTYTHPLSLSRIHQTHRFKRLCICCNFFSHFSHSLIGSLLSTPYICSRQRSPTGWRWRPCEFQHKKGLFFLRTNNMLWGGKVGGEVFLF